MSRDTSACHSNSCARLLLRTLPGDASWAAPAALLCMARRLSTCGAVFEQADSRTLGTGHHGGGPLGNEGPGSDDSRHRSLTGVARLRGTGVEVLARICAARQRANHRAPTAGASGGPVRLRITTAGPSPVCLSLSVALYARIARSPGSPCGERCGFTLFRWNDAIG
jgi:hypothetical protein